MPSLGDFNTGMTALNTGLTGLQVKRNNQLLEEQLQLQRQQQQLDHEFKLHSDPTYREWWEERVARLGREYAAEQQRQEAEAAERHRRSAKIWWIVGIVLVPYIVVWLPYSRRHLPRWGYYLLIAWAALVLISNITQMATGGSGQN